MFLPVLAVGGNLFQPIPPLRLRQLRQKRLKNFAQIRHHRQIGRHVFVDFRRVHVELDDNLSVAEFGAVARHAVGKAHAADGCFDKTGNLIFFGKKYGGFALYNINSDSLLLENKLPGNHREQPIMPICYYSNNILLFATEVKREKQIIKYYITENRFETILRGDRYYKLMGKMGEACIGYYYEDIDDDDQMKINLIKLNEDGEIASKIVDTDGSNTLLYKDKFYYLYQYHGNCYEIRCLDENFEEYQVGYIKRKKSFFADNLCLNEKYIAFI